MNSVIYLNVMQSICWLFSLEMILQILRDSVNLSRMLFPMRSFSFICIRSREDGAVHPSANEHVLSTRDYSPSLWSQQGNYGGGLDTGGSMSAKQHYLTRSRYVAGQSTKLPLRNSNANTVTYGTVNGGELIWMVFWLLVHISEEYSLCI